MSTQSTCSRNVCQCLIHFPDPTKLYDQIRVIPCERRSWKLLGVPVAIRCLARALAIHERRICPRGRVDRRFKCTGAVPRSHWV